MDEDDILSALKEGAEDAFRRLFDAYYDTLVMFANHWVNDPEAAEDVVQDCFTDFWANKRLENLTEGLDKYIFASVKHAALNYIRSNQRREQRHLEMANNHMEEENGTAELSEEELEYLYTTINRMPEERKKIFMMVCMEGKKYQEVADLLEISINTVKTQMARAFQFLRTTLDKQRFAMFLLTILKFIQREDSAEE